MVRVYVQLNGRCNDAVLDMPYKLMISVFILALILPVIVDSSETLVHDQQVQQLEVECGYLADSIQMVYAQGRGASKSITLTLPEQTELVEAGTVITRIIQADRASIRFQLTDGTANRLFVKSGGVYITISSGTDSPFQIIGPGEHRIYLQKNQIDLDLNGDGIKPDHYVQLSKV